MYKIKEGKKEEIRKNNTNRKLANKIGVTEGYISQIINGKKINITKTTAYAFTKAIASDLEIQDIFEII